MEVATPLSPTDFDFNASAYGTAPSTPRFMGDISSAPTSPARIPDFYNEFDELFISEDSGQRYTMAAVPFAWEERPGVPKSISNFFNNDFEFDVSGELYRDSSVSAEDKFKPAETEQAPAPVQRGRERVNPDGTTHRSRSRRTRSLPPFRGSELQLVPTNTAAPASSSTLSTSGSGKGSKKWSFMDFFLFRSASDGRAMDKDPLKKHSSIFWKHEDFRNSTLRDRSGSGSGSKRRGRVSAHEFHYTVNRAVSIDMQKQSFLPYKQGILGRLAFNPTVHALSNRFGHSHNNYEN